MPILLTSLTQKPIDKLLDSSNPPSPIVDKSVLTDYITYKSPKWDDIVKPQLERRDAQIAETIKLGEEARQKAIEAARIAKQAQEVQTPPPATNVAYSGSHADWLNAAGVPADQQQCATLLINKESGFRVDAYNPSGAYGIPQSLPGSKMASAGADWQTNPVTQIRWMVGYVNDRYGGFCQAWAHSQAANWY